MGPRTVLVAFWDPYRNDLEMFPLLLRSRPDAVSLPPEIRGLVRRAGKSLRSQPIAHLARYDVAQSCIPITCLTFGLVAKQITLGHILNNYGSFRQANDPFTKLDPQNFVPSFETGVHQTTKRTRRRTYQLDGCWQYRSPVLKNFVRNLFDFRSSTAPIKVRLCRVDCLTFTP